MTEAPPATRPDGTYIPSIYESINEVMEEVRAVGKAQRNTQQNYNFRGIDAVVNAAGPAFRNHGIVPTPLLESVAFRDVKTSTGKDSREVTVQVRYRFYGPRGDYIDAVVPGESMDFGDKGSPKAMSVAYRIALLQVLCIPTDDADPDAQSYERAGDSARPAPPAQPDRDWLKDLAGATTSEAVRELGKAAAAAGVWAKFEPQFRAQLDAMVEMETAAKNLQDGGLVTPPKEEATPSGS